MKEKGRPFRLCGGGDYTRSHTIPQLTAAAAANGSIPQCPVIRLLRSMSALVMLMTTANEADRWRT